MESGLEDRNNPPVRLSSRLYTSHRLNGVRPRRPEQWEQVHEQEGEVYVVSMESGLEDRNNAQGRPVVSSVRLLVSMESGLEDRNNCHTSAACSASCASQWSPA